MGEEASSPSVSYSLKSNTNTDRPSEGKASVKEALLNPLAAYRYPVILL